MGPDRMPSPGWGAGAPLWRSLAVYAMAEGEMRWSVWVAQPPFVTQQPGWCKTPQPSQRSTASPSWKERSQSGQKR